MINGRRVIAWTPYGRVLTYSLLIKYLKREVEKGVVDEVWLFMNTDPTGQEQDVAFAHEVAEQYPWAKLVYRPEGIPRHPGPKQRNTGYAYRYMADPDAVYVRLDDDIVYLHEDALTNLVQRRIETPAPTAIFATVWNNAIVSWFAQQAGVIPKEFGIVGGPYCMNGMGWSNGQFAVDIHRLLLDHAEAGTADKLYLYQDFPIQNPESGSPSMQFSVSGFASLGSMYAALPAGPGVLVPDEEESWHTEHQPTVTGVPNLLVGNALISHFTFMGQRAHVLANPDILDRYRALAEAL